MQLSGQDEKESCFQNLAISSFDEVERSENLNGKLECEPTACLSTGIWRGCSLKWGYIRLYWDYLWWWAASFHLILNLFYVDLLTKAFNKHFM